MPSDRSAIHGDVGCSFTDRIKICHQQLCLSKRHRIDRAVFIRAAKVFGCHHHWVIAAGKSVVAGRDANPKSRIWSFIRFMRCPGLRKSMSWEAATASSTWFAQKDRTAMFSAAPVGNRSLGAVIGSEAIATLMIKEVFCKHRLCMGRCGAIQGRIGSVVFGRRRDRRVAEPLLSSIPSRADSAVGFAGPD